jgi:5-formyltetrahydrofolate cyclo-ligase
VDDRAGKAGWRASLLAARARLGSDQLAAASAAVRRHVLAEVAGTRRIAAYVPVGREPGSLDLLDALRDTGIDVLLPVVSSDGLDWAAYRGSAGLVAGALGIREPAGPRLGVDAIAVVDTVLVPALAVDHVGTRLGRGGGFYDRTLGRVRPGRPVAALLHDGELVPALPADPWDRPVTAVVTPATGWTELPVVEHHVR